ncbi:hypothetical protein MY3296_005491 [Beauveria thailandica]
MQPQFILASLFAGLAAAIGTSAYEEPAAVDGKPIMIAGEEYATVYCDKGKALPGGPGGRTFCIGVRGENFGVAKECAQPFCLDDCDYAKDDNGCAICGPDCAWSHRVEG